MVKKLSDNPQSGFPVMSKMDQRPKFRVFISYSHEDRSLVEGIAAILEANGLKPMWEENFAYGQGFHEQIKNFIAHAHVFSPF